MFSETSGGLVTASRILNINEPSQPEVIDDRDGDLLLGPKGPLGRTIDECANSNLIYSRSPPLPAELSTGCLLMLS